MMEGFSLNSHILGGIGLLAGVFAYGCGLARARKLSHIPTVGPSDPLGSWWSAIKYFVSADQVIQQGFDKYQKGVFKIATLSGWTVILSPNEMDEVAKAPTNVFSGLDAVADILQMDYSLGPEIYRNPYHAPITRAHFKRHIADLYPEIRDEMCVVLDEILDFKTNEWKTLPIAGTTESILCRTSNRVLVGFPLCRDPDWLDLTLQTVFGVVAEGSLVGHLPGFLAPYVAKCITRTSSRTKRGMKHLTPLIKERQKCMEEYGERWRDKPFDVLQCCLDYGDETTPPLLTARMLTFALASIHSSSVVFSKTLCLLARHPEYIQPLREEAEKVISENGWTMGAATKLRKIDSFIKEAIRFEGGVTIGPSRKARTDVTLSDGVFIPRGTTVSFPAHSIEHDEQNYENPYVFKPFRFVDLQDKSDDPSKYHLTSVSNDFLVFGIGKVACPGRFVAAMTLKTLLAHILINYDLKPAEQLPRTLRVNGIIFTDPRSKIMIRKRMD